jgi:hypothetical protein
VKTIDGSYRHVDQPEQAHSHKASPWLWQPMEIKRFDFISIIVISTVGGQSAWAWWEMALVLILWVAVCRLIERLST